MLISSVCPCYCQKTSNSYGHGHEAQINKIRNYGAYCLAQVIINYQRFKKGWFRSAPFLIGKHSGHSLFQFFGPYWGRHLNVDRTLVFSFTWFNDHSKRLVLKYIIAQPVVQCPYFVLKIDQAHDVDKNPDQPGNKSF